MYEGPHQIANRKGRAALSLFESAGGGRSRALALARLNCQLRRVLSLRQREQQDLAVMAQHLLELPDAFEIEICLDLQPIAPLQDHRLLAVLPCPIAVSEQHLARMR